MPASERAESRDCIYNVLGCTWYLVLGAESSGGEIWENISTPDRQPDCTHSGVLQKRLLQQNMDFLLYRYYNISILARQHLHWAN